VGEGNRPDITPVASGCLFQPPCFLSQNRMLGSSSDAEARSSELWEKLTDRTPPRWPLSVRSGSPLAMPQARMV